MVLKPWFDLAGEWDILVKIKSSDVGDSNLRGRLLEFKQECLVPHQLGMKEIFDI